METTNNAQWLINPDGWYPYCSQCGHEPKNGITSNYCPDCGAHMIEKRENSMVRVPVEIIDEIKRHLSQIRSYVDAFPDTYYKVVTTWKLEDIDELLEKVGDTNE